MALRELTISAKGGIVVVTVLLLSGIYLWLYLSVAATRTSRLPGVITGDRKSRGGGAGREKSSPHAGGREVTLLRRDDAEEDCRMVADPPEDANSTRRQSQQRLQREGKAGKEEEEEEENVPWFVSNHSRRPDEVRHIVFVKVHKAASTSLFDMLLRFAMSRDLNVMFPRKGGSSLSIKHNGWLAMLAAHPPSPPFLFHILCHHVIFVRDQIAPYLPPDTTYITIVRDPWEQVSSAFYYYSSVFKLRYLLNAPSFEEFVRNQSRFEHKDPYFSYTNNRQSLDLGLPRRFLGNPSRVPQFLGRLESQFRLVMVAESLPQSLVLLRRTLKWTLKDALYLSCNAGEARRRAPIFQPDERLKADFQRFQMFDVAVYRHFLTVFQRKVAEQGPGFQDDVRDFQCAQRRVARYCRQALEVRPPALFIPGSRWNTEGLTLRSAECWTLDRRDLREKAQLKQLQRLFPGGGDYFIPTFNYSSLPDSLHCTHTRQ